MIKTFKVYKIKKMNLFYRLIPLFNRVLIPVKIQKNCLNILIITKIQI